MKIGYQNCPLCGKPETAFYLVDSANRKFFRCEYCNEFQISIDTEKHLKDISQKSKKTLSDQSHKHSPQKMLFVDLCFVGQLKGLLAKFYDRSLLPQT